MEKLARPEGQGPTASKSGRPWDRTLWTAAEAKDIDRFSTQDYGIPSLTLMEEAGQALFRMALKLWKPHSQFYILAGPGNNGGDALVLARLLFQADFPVQVFDVRDDDSKESVERKTQRERLESLALPLQRFEEKFPAPPPGLVIVDGLLGLGFHGKIRPGRIRACLEEAAKLQARSVLAIDLPSGLDADVWQQEKALLSATHTLTFGAKKTVHLADPSRLSCGEVSVAPLSFAEGSIDKVLAARPFRLEKPRPSHGLDAIWQKLPRDAHKYTRGHVLVLGGSPGKCGAPLLSAEAALRSGSGWVSVALLSQTLAPPLPEVFTYEDFAGKSSIDVEALERFLRERRVKGIAIGPGTMQSPLSGKLMRMLHALQKSENLFLLFDAGTLQDFPSVLGDLKLLAERTLLTPHPGEWARLAKDLPALKGLDDLSLALRFCERWGLTIIYKSSTPITLSPGRVSFQAEGSNALGKAGSGDVFAGIALALGAAGWLAHDAATEGQSLLAGAGRRAAVARGTHSLSPLDIIRHIAKAQALDL